MGSCLVTRYLTSLTKGSCIGKNEMGPYACITPNTKITPIIGLDSNCSYGVDYGKYDMRHEPWSISHLWKHMSFGQIGELEGKFSRDEAYTI